MTIAGMTSMAEQLMTRKGFVFADFCELFTEFNHALACQLFNSVLEAVLKQSVSEGKSAYSDQVHLAESGEFNLSLVVVGEGVLNHQTICASEFDMIVVSLSSEPVSIPVYRALLDVNHLFERPEPLVAPVSHRLDPFSPVVFHAYRDIVDLENADTKAPLLIIHSLPRGSVTWVYERESLQPLNLTDNNLQKSRIQLAVRVIGDMGSEEYADTLEALATSDFDHFVRWEAAESVYKLNEQRGIELLQQHLVNDTNQSLAKSARQTLVNLTSGEG
ncbi:hypothetical protein GZ77_25210 [Endozoicomonas montiporae]|uniref:HEAT repeat domain-containing protein n=2 Tax=Endozoicomonas montiporae TaxID=1027273 RepID=A0A081MYY8_9GAMM|nr:hypothetical protein GZ77_25210 [Endozoicomonas montiporae]